MTGNALLILLIQKVKSGKEQWFAQDNFKQIYKNINLITYFNYIFIKLNNIASPLFNYLYNSKKFVLI